MEWRGREWRGGEGRAGQGRVPDCLGGLSRVGISSRSTRPWNGQPPSYYCIWSDVSSLELPTVLFEDSRQRPETMYCKCTNWQHLLNLSFVAFFKS